MKLISDHNYINECEVALHFATTIIEVISMFLFTIITNTWSMANLWYWRHWETWKKVLLKLYVMWRQLRLRQTNWEMRQFIWAIIDTPHPQVELTISMRVSFLFWNDTGGMYNFTAYTNVGLGSSSLQNYTNMRLILVFCLSEKFVLFWFLLLFLI